MMIIIIFYFLVEGVRVCEANPANSNDIGVKYLRRSNMDRVCPRPPRPRRFSVVPCPSLPGVLHLLSLQRQRYFPDAFSFFCFFLSFFFLLKVRLNTSLISTAQGSTQTNQTTCATAHRNSTKKTNKNH